MVFLSSTGSFQKRPFEEPHVEEPAFGIALAEQTRDEAQEGRWFSPPHNGSVSKLAYAVVILTTRVLSPAPIKSPRQIRGQGCLSVVSLAPCSWIVLHQPTAKARARERTPTMPSKAKQSTPAKKADTAKGTSAKKASPAEGASAKRASTDKGASGKKVNPALMKPLQPSKELAAVVGSDPLPRAEVVSKVWDYIKTNKLQDPQNKREIMADDKLQAVFGKNRVTMFEMNKHLAQHLT
jgi:upstream activation factor subunit UAF30